MAHVGKQCPSLRYLSLLKNPCCPNFLEERGGKDLSDYQLHRCASPVLATSSCQRIALAAGAVRGGAMLSLSLTHDCHTHAAISCCTSCRA